MSTEQTIEKRLAQLEREVAELKQHVGKSLRGNGWLGQITGSFKDDPEFDEVLRLGQEIRRADQVRDGSKSGS